MESSFFCYCISRCASMYIHVYTYICMCVYTHQKLFSKTNRDPAQRIVWELRFHFKNSILPFDLTTITIQLYFEMEEHSWVYNDVSSRTKRKEKHCLYMLQVKHYKRLKMAVSLWILGLLLLVSNAECCLRNVIGLIQFLWKEEVWHSIYCTNNFPNY